MASTESLEALGRDYAINFGSQSVSSNREQPADPVREALQEAVRLYSHWGLVAGHIDGEPLAAGRWINAARDALRATPKAEPPADIDYFVIHEYAERTQGDYNALCAMVRAALAQAQRPAEPPAEYEARKLHERLDGLGVPRAEPDHGTLYSLLGRFDLAVAQRPAEPAPSLLAQFGAWCIHELRGDNLGTDINGGDAQDEMERLGLLSRTTVTEPCREEGCVCAEYGFPADCLRLTDAAYAGPAPLVFPSEPPSPSVHQTARDGEAVQRPVDGEQELTK